MRAIDTQVLFIYAKLKIAESRLVAIPPGLGPGCRGFESPLSEYEQKWGLDLSLSD